MTESIPESAQWFTYAEAAARLGITQEAARTQSRRGNWPKQRPNGHGLPARVQVPLSLLTDPRPPPVHPVSFTERDHPGQTPDDTRSALDAQIATLREHLADLRATLDRAAAREASDAATIAFLRSLVEQERAGQEPSQAAPRRLAWWRSLLARR